MHYLLSSQVKTILNYLVSVVLPAICLLLSTQVNAQSIDISLSASGNTDPGGTVTITMTVTCNDTLRCRLGNYPNPNADGMITVTGNATPGLFDIPQDISRFGFFTPGQSKSRSVDIMLNGAQGDIITIEAFADGYCRANDSNGPGGADTREINCDDTETLNLLTTPVTLSSFDSEVIGDKVKIDWSTSSELFNVGFQLWGLDGTDSSWTQLHSWLVRSGSGNAVETQSYSKTSRVPSSISDLVALGISSVDSDGREHYYGPFNVGQSYGDLSALLPIAWDTVRREVDTQMMARGYVKDGLRGYRKVALAADGSAGTETVIEFKVAQAGLYRLTAAQLRQAGLDWRAVAQGDIAVIDYQGDSVVRYTSATGAGTGPSKALGEHGEIYFYGQGPDQTAGLYTDSSVYRLVLDRTRALTAPYQGKQGISGGYSEAYEVVSRLERDRQYSLSSAADDPWLDEVLVSYADKTASYGAALAVEADALWARDAVLTLEMARGSALASVDDDGDGVQDPEHTIQAVVLSSNGPGGLFPVGDAQAVGLGDWTRSFTVPGGTPLTLIDGQAVVGGVFKAGTGYAFSEVHIDAVEFRYYRPYVAKAGDDHLWFTAPADGAKGYAVTVPDTGWPQVFAYNDAGALVRLGLESQTSEVLAGGETVRGVRFAALKGAPNAADPVNYWVSGKRGMLTVDGLSVKTIASKDSLLAQLQGSSLLMVVHPVFMTAELMDYAEFKRSQGYRVSVIDYVQVVEAFGGGQAGPHGLTVYLQAAEGRGDVEHVLLVGGGSYDHTDKLGTGALTFIPGHYGESGYSSYTLTDTPYIEADDGSLFATMGRWPVRTGADLSVIIANSRTWSQSHRSAGSVLSIAEHTVVGEGIDFSVALDGVEGVLPTSWSRTRVDVDTILKANPGLSLVQAIARAKAEIITGLEAGPDVVLYNGHGTSSQLSNKALLKSSDIAPIKGQGAQMWVPMSCYMTYYESTHSNTLAYQLLFSGRAVGISGSMLLSNQASNMAAGTAVLEGMVSGGISVGEAIKRHKAVQSSATVNTNLGHLGDPTLRM